MLISMRLHKNMFTKSGAWTKILIPPLVLTRGLRGTLCCSQNLTDEYIFVFSV